MKARIQAWCREIAVKLVQASEAGDIERYKNLRRLWLGLQRKAMLG